MAYSSDTMIMAGNSFLALKDVPPLWLIRWHNTHKGNKYAGHKRKLLEWIESNIEFLKQMLPKEEEIFPPALPVSKTINPINLIKRKDVLMCIKTIYKSKKSAEAALKRILQLPGKEKKPVNCYQCNICGFWHLTSLKSKAKFK